MLVRDVMTANPLVVKPDDPLQLAKDHMAAANCRRVPVVDDMGQLCGIITDRDVRLAANSPLVMRERWEDEHLLHQTPVAACMTPDPVWIEPDARVEDAIDLMLERKISGLPVVEHKQLVGVVTVTDLMRVLRDLLRSR